MSYLLTLSCHGFYAFHLATDVEAPVWHEERPVPPDLPVLVLVGTGWRTLFGRAEDGEAVNQLMARRARDQLERQIIPRFFRTQPWFPDKDAAVEKFKLGEMYEWSTESGSWLLTVAVLTLANGETRRYAISLALAWEDEDESRLSTLLHATLAKVRRRARMGILLDAFWDDAFCRTVVSSMRRGSTTVFGSGQLHFEATRAFPGFACPADTMTVTRTVSERGRLLVNLGDHLMLKGYRWLLAGVHPELEVSRFLTETAKFTHMTQLAGTVEYVDGETQRSTLAILERYGENQGNAWIYTLDYLERFLDECLARPEHPPDARHAAYRELIRTLGLRTAEFHRALALPDSTGAFGSEPVTGDDIAGWVKSAHVQISAMYALLEAELPWLADAAQLAGNSLLAVRPRLYRRIMHAVRASAIGAAGIAKARYHGDYHLGQVWLSSNDFLITNYGGEPGQTWAERRRKHTPLRDLASMLLSFSEAAAVALDHVAADVPEKSTTLRQQIDNWQALASRDFFRSYRRAMNGQALFPEDERTADTLVTLFMIEKASASVSDALTQRSKTVDATVRRLVQLAQRKR